MINKTIIHGRITRDLELRRTQNDIPVLAFTIATDNGYGEKKQASFIDCVAWRGTAETIAKYCGKGSEIDVEGHLQSRSYEDKNGNKRSVLELIIDSFDFCGSKGEQPHGDYSEIVEDNDDEGGLPF